MKVHAIVAMYNSTSKKSRNFTRTAAALFALEKGPSMLTSSAFGEFDPLNPKTIPRIFAKNVYAKPVEIDAPITTVWKIITDFDLYPEWNPLNRFFRLDSKPEPNHTVTFGPSWGPYGQAEGEPLPNADFTQRETITIWEENCCFGYSAISWLINGERIQYLSTLENGKTQYLTYDRIGGPLSPFVLWKYGAKMEAGFTANGIALKNRAEALSGS